MTSLKLHTCWMLRNRWGWGGWVGWGVMTSLKLHTCWMLRNTFWLGWVGGVGCNDIVEVAHMSCVCTLVHVDATQLSCVSTLVHMVDATQLSCVSTLVHMVDATQLSCVSTLAHMVDVTQLSCVSTHMVWWQSCKAYWAARVNALGHSPANFLNLNNDSSWLYAWRYGKGEKKTECRPLKTSRTWGKMHIPIPKSHFYHGPSAHARNYGKMHGSHPNFEKLTIDFMLRRHYKCAFYTVICGIFITSLLSDLSLRVVTYDRTVVLNWHDFNLTARNSNKQPLKDSKGKGFHTFGCSTIITFILLWCHLRKSYTMNDISSASALRFSFSKFTPLLFLRTIFLWTVYIIKLFDLTNDVFR